MNVFKCCSYTLPYVDLCPPPEVNLARSAFHFCYLLLSPSREVAACVATLAVTSYQYFLRQELS